MHGSQFGRRDRATVPLASVRMVRFKSDLSRDTRAIAEECPVALVFDGTTVAVLVRGRDFEVFSHPAGIAG